MNGVEIRRGVIADAPRFTVLAAQVWLDNYARDGIRRATADYVLREFTVARAEALLADPGALVLVAERDAHLIGFAVVVPRRAAPGCDDATAAEIDRLYVHEHSCRTGIGTALLGTIAAHAAALGIRQLWLKVWVHNARARHFYARHAFVDIGTAYFELDGEQHENRVLAKTLSLTPTLCRAAGEGDR